jgi:Icc-related predicted phosphoesterase
MQLAGHRLKLPALFILLVIACLGFSCREQKDVLTLVQLCDPQLGFGEDGSSADSARFNQAVRQINELSPDVVVIAGDMVNDVNDERAVRTFLAQIAGIRSPVVLTPGNHDLPDPVTDERLKRYRSIFGDDFTVMECKGRCIISANSQLWREAPREDTGIHFRKLYGSLQQAEKKGQPVIMITHVPPFVTSVDEPDEYYNLPAPVRGELLRLCEAYGVFVWLAGHIHKTTRRSYGSVIILNGETTSRNFDNRPAGFRRLTVRPDNSFEWEFTPLTNN